MLRFCLVGIPGLMLALTGCIDVSFSDTTTDTSTSVGGASTATTSSGGGGGSEASTTTTGGTGGGVVADCTNKRCGPDGIGGLCGGKVMAPTWSVDLPSGARAVVPWPETQSVFVTTSQDIVVRIDECDGSVMATNSAVSESVGDNRHFLLAAGLYNGQLMILGATNASGANADHRYYLDASSSGLAVTTSETLNNGWGKAAGYGFSDPTGLYIAQSGGSVGSLPPGMAACATSYSGFTNYTARGVLRTSTAVYTANVDTPFPSLIAGKLLSTCAAACACPSSKTHSLPTNVIYNDLVDTGVDLVAVGTSSGGDTRLGHIDPTDLGESNVLNFNSGASTGSSTLLNAVFSGGFVYAGGARGLSAADALARDPAGDAILYRVPTTFVAGTTPDIVVLTGGVRVRTVSADPTGIFAAGTKTDGVKGFLAKCTAALDCDPLPP